ncbi:MAG: homoserine kinase [Desulfovibrionaceae bacterium]|nr:homoserine kinase [Desulfovibrionaceae bacterium]
MSDASPMAPNSIPERACLILIGMAGAGKTKMGLELARLLNWAHVDADSLIEAAYGTNLQRLVDRVDRETFLDMEAAIIQSIRLQRCVISTGGSVVYREKSMKYLHGLGPVMRLDVPMNIILERIARRPDRGLVIGLGQTVEGLFHERRLLYKKYSSLAIVGGNRPAQDYARQAMPEVLEALRRWAA